MACNPHLQHHRVIPPYGGTLNMMVSMPRVQNTPTGFPSAWQFQHPWNKHTEQFFSSLRWGVFGSWSKRILSQLQTVAICVLINCSIHTHAHIHIYICHISFAVNMDLHWLIKHLDRQTHRQTDINIDPQVSAMCKLCCRLYISMHFLLWVSLLSFLNREGVWPANCDTKTILYVVGKKWASPITGQDWMFHCKLIQTS